MDGEFYKQYVSSYKLYAYILFTTTAFTMVLLYVQSYVKINQFVVVTNVDFPTNSGFEWTSPSMYKYLDENYSQYLVSSPRCKIPNLDPYNLDISRLFHATSYKPCNKAELLTYTSVDNNEATLHVNESLISFYSKSGISCCYSNVTRGTDKNDPDWSIKISSCEAFESNVTLGVDTVIVKCKNHKNTQIYKNAHAVVTIKDDVQKKLDNSSRIANNYLSVLFVGVDSVSRLNMIRSLPKTLKFLEQNKWIEMRGYNKMGDNTFPNLMAILTGRNESDAYKNCNPRSLGKLDKCNFLWYSYRDLGYVTGYAEDEGSISTFNFRKKGFTKQPTDYYFRPYVLAAEKNLKTVRLDGMTYCVGPETYGERILHVAKDFVKVFAGFPYFGFFWMNSYSHNELNSVSRMDGKLLGFLKDISEGDKLENSIVLFLSDHGMRFGKVRYTRTGWLEERLPFFYMKLPSWFETVFPDKYKNLMVNQNRFTTPYDLHMTLQDILSMSSKSYSVVPSIACPRCQTLFQEVAKNRSCQDAEIEQHWCTCNDYASLSTKNSTVQLAAKFILGEVLKTAQSLGKEHTKCAKFKLKNIQSSSIAVADFQGIKKKYLLIIFETSPTAFFEGTVSVEAIGTSSPIFKMEGSISRLDFYQFHSHCVNDSKLKLYCYCYR